MNSNNIAIKAYLYSEVNQVLLTLLQFQMFCILNELNTVNLGYNKLGYKESSAIRNSFEIPESFPSLFHMKQE